MKELVIHEVDLENNNDDHYKNNNIEQWDNKQWDNCCFYTGMSGVIIVVGTFIIILVLYIIQTL